MRKEPTFEEELARCRSLGMELISLHYYPYSGYWSASVGYGKHKDLCESASRYEPVAAFTQAIADAAYTAIKKVTS